jgi:PP-loop superfamily ATP-utilizing enzyme
MKTEKQKLNKVEINSQNFESLSEKIIAVQQQLKSLGYELENFKLQIFFSEQNPKTLEEIYEQKNIELL